MLPKILNLKDVQPLNKNQKINIKGGFLLPTEEDCGCRVPGPGGILTIVSTPCNSTCPDGTSPIRGLHH